MILPWQSYLKARAARGPWKISGAREQKFYGAVVIPALAESAGVLDALASLAANPAPCLSRFLILVVVNHRADACPEDKKDNEKTLALIEEFGRKNPHMRLACVDACSPGLELPSKQGGVGLARKIGLDLALELLDWSADPVLVCLDADTEVEPAYLPAIERHFRTGSAGGAVIPFRHRKGETLEEHRAIVRYELFLRCYVLGLSLAQSPYAFHTVGSAMACRASAYVKMGGMNLRSAAEDFYFLQQLSRVAGVTQIDGTCVHPSPRRSHRVPFGTGRSVERLLAGDPQAVLFYRPECFNILACWLRLVREQNDADGEQLLAKAGTISPFLASYLASASFAQSWDRFLMQFREPSRRLKAFDDWFDGLKTMKLIHYLSAEIYCRCPPAEAVPSLLAAAGLPQPASACEQLALLQQLQNGIPAASAAFFCSEVII